MRVTYGMQPSGLHGGPALQGNLLKFAAASCTVPCSHRTRFHARPSRSSLARVPRGAQAAVRRMARAPPPRLRPCPPAVPVRRGRTCGGARRAAAQTQECGGGGVCGTRSRAGGKVGARGCAAATAGGAQERSPAGYGERGYTGVKYQRMEVDRRGWVGGPGSLTACVGQGRIVVLFARVMANP
eukprot:364904-Chlamydomonas_euryale.AAC.17